MAKAKATSGVIGWPGTLTVVEVEAGPGEQDGYVLVDGQVRPDSFLLSNQFAGS